MSQASISNAERVERILIMLQEVRTRGLISFGANVHGFKLNKPLDEQAVVRFETEHSVKLPDALRSFLLLAGDGGAGPYYGIYSLEQFDECVSWTTDDSPVDCLRLPCPLYPKMSRDEEWQSQFTDCISPYQGIIAIGTQGCSYEMGLIVTGNYAGRVVYLDLDGQPPYVVRDPDFLAWYERWLDELLAGCDTDWFGYGIGGDEDSLVGMLEDPQTTDDDRSEALHAIHRLPKISLQTQAKVVRRLSDHAADVRSAACTVVEKFSIADAGRAILALLDDATAKVQQVAIGANMKLQSELALDKIMSMLDAVDQDVARLAFSALSRERKLSRSMLLRLAEFSPHDFVRYCAAYELKWQAGDDELLVRLLADQNPEVRLLAVQGLRQLFSRKSLGSAVDLLARETDDKTIDSILKMLGDISEAKNADVLLAWAASSDDFHRLAAIDGLCKIGDVRVKTIAESLLHEKRKPRRLDSRGLCECSGSTSIGILVRESLAASPNRELRKLS